MRTLTLALSLVVATSALAQPKKATPSPAPSPALSPPPSPAPSPAPPPAPPPRVLAALRLGLLLPLSALDPTARLDAEVLARLPVLDGNLYAGLDLGWARPKGTMTVTSPLLQPSGAQTGAAQSLPAALGIAQFHLGLSASYRAALIGALPRLTLAGTLGGGILWARAAATAFGANWLEKKGVPAFWFALGADHALGPGAVLLELRYVLAPIDLDVTGSTHLGGLAPALGYRMGF